MASNAKSRVRRAASSGRPVRDANFVSKRERKQVRKSMVRAYLANRVAEARVGAAERAEFYRNLRHMKLRRRKIAAEMHVLGDMVAGLHREITRTVDRYNTRSSSSDVEGTRLLREVQRSGDEARELAKAAQTSVATAADEFQLFAQRRIYFTEAAA
jgi:hypothetical protein